MRKQRFVLAVALAASLGICGSAMAESNSGGSPQTARLNFEVVIPTFLLFQVGTAGTGNIDTITFSPTANDIITDNASVSGTGGDQGGGVVTVNVLSNGGEVTITEANDGGGNGLSDGSGGSISYSRIDTATSDSGLPAPILSDAGGNTANVALTVGDFTLANADWTYTFDATDVQASPGTYTGQVTYTASTP